MNKAFKAALVSALIFPGIGHFSLKKPLQGSLLAGASFVCLYFMVSAIMEVANQIVVKIQNGDIPMDVTNISNIVASQLAGSDGRLINIPSYMLMVLWVVGIVDSYRVGLSQQKSKVATEKKA
jgi:hypothetical protein